jgi:asparagine synthase (glutamine-hydrolysing)
METYCLVLEINLVCGILFYADLDKALNKNQVKSSFDQISYRGPDKTTHLFFNSYDKQYEEPNIAMCHHRLAFNDLSDSANQPFRTIIEGREYTLIFNGEIYNYKKLRTIIARKFNVRFITSTDTEVFLFAYHYYGKECFKLFDGVWAAVIYEHCSKNITISRDRLGEKPLYLFKDSKKIIICSEIKPILSLLGRVEINVEEFNCSVLGGVDGSTLNTCFASIYKFPPSTFSKINIAGKVNELSRGSYWSIDDVGERDFKSFEHAREEFKGILTEAILDRLDVSSEYVPISLSGGLDSNIIAATLHSSNTKFVSFSHIYSDHDLYKEIDETVAIDDAISAYGNDNYKYSFDYSDPKSVIDIYKRKILAYEWPVGSIGLAGYKTYETVREKKFRYIIEGQGADEVFGGYSSYTGVFKCIQNTFKKNIIDCSIGGVKKSDFCFKYLKNKYLRYHMLSFAYFKKAEILQIKFDKNTIDYMYFRDYENNPRFRDRTTIHDFLKGQITRNLSYLLFTGDRDSMMNGVESRLPFTSHKVIEFAASLPTNYLLFKNQLKGFLRESYRDLIPPHIYHQRKKVGYPDALEIHYQSDVIFRQKVNELLLKSGFTNSDITKLVNSNLIFQAVSMKLFLQQFG